MKRRKAIRIVLCAAILIGILAFFSGECSAQETFAEDYSALLDASGARDLLGTLPDDAESSLRTWGIAEMTPDSLAELSPDRLFADAADSLVNAARSPLQACGMILGLLVLCALLDGWRTSLSERSLSGVFSAVSALAVSTAVLVPLIGVVERAGQALYAAGQFTLSLSPVLAGIMLTGGQTAAAGSCQLLLYGIGQLYSWAASAVIVPLLTIFIAFSVVCSLAPELNLSGVAEFIHKAASWVLGLFMTVFVGLMTLQGAVGGAADSVGLRTAKFFAGSVVPVVGGAIGDALSSVVGCVRLLRTSVGAVGIFADVAIFFVPLAEVVMWQLMLSLTAAIGELFGVKPVAQVLKMAAKALGLLSAVIVCSALVLLISTAIMMLLGGNGG